MRGHLVTCEEDRLTYFLQNACKSGFLQFFCEICFTWSFTTTSFKHLKTNI